MADVADVGEALKAFCAGALYPQGPSQPSAAGVSAQVIHGYPSRQKLDALLAQAAAVVSIDPGPTGRNTTRYLGQRADIPPLSPKTYTLTAAGVTVTVGGAPPATFYPQILTLTFADHVSSILTTPGMSAAAAASALAAVIPDGVAVGAVITLDSPPVAARVGSSTVAKIETGREMRPFNVRVWAKDHPTRTAVVKVIKPALQGMAFLPMLADPDDDARLRFVNDITLDKEQAQGMYRRDLTFSAEFASYLLETQYEITSTVLNLEPQSGNARTTII